MVDAAVARIAQACLQAPMHAAPWQHVAQSIEQELTGMAVMINLAPGWSPLGPAFAEGFDPASLCSLAERFHRANPWAGISHCYQEGYFGHGFDYFSPAQLRVGEFYNEWMRPAGLSFDVAYGGVPVLRGGVDELLVAVMGHRGAKLEPPEIEICSRVMPYLKHVFLILERLAHVVAGSGTPEVGAPAWSTQVLDRICLGAFVVSSAARILHINRAGEELLQQGCLLRAVNGRIEAGTQHETKALRDLIAAAAGNIASRPGASYIGMDSHPPGLQVIAAPLPAGEGPAGSVLLLTSPPDLAARDISELLKRSFGLTNSEASLTVQLARLFNLREAAEVEQISYETARSYFKRAASKLGVQSQTGAIERVRALGLIRGR